MNSQREAAAEIVYAAMLPNNDPAVPWSAIKNEAAKAPIYEATDRILALTPAALADIAAECERHVSVEGWTAEHDDTHYAGELATAGGLYATMAIRGDNDHRYRGNGSAPPGWPWAARWWKPGQPRRMLVKAASLIVAEISRIDRQRAR